MARELATARQSPVEIEIRSRLHEIAELHPQGKNERVKQQLFHALSQSVTKNPQLAQCDPSTIVIAACQAVALGLDLNPVLGEAYLVPRWNSQIRANECCFQPGYQGLVKLVRKTGQIVKIRAALVYDADVFRYSYTPDLTFEHIPAMKQQGAVTDGKGVKAVYAYAKLANGEEVIEVMTVSDVQGIRQASKAANSGPWVAYWGEMAKKTVLRRLIKMLPKGEGEVAAALETALEAHDAEYEFDRALEKPKTNNNSGHATGKYASPEQTRQYLEAISKYASDRNAKWLDWVNAEFGDDVPGLKNLYVDVPSTDSPALASRTMLDNHLVRWAADSGRLDPSSCGELGTTASQLGRFTAIVYFRSKEDRAALAREAERFLNEKAQRGEQAIRDAFAAGEPADESGGNLGGGFDDLTEDNFVQEPEAVEVKPEPAPTPSKPGRKPKQESLVEDNDPEAWPAGRE